MGNISVSLPSDGETIDVADYNTPINTIVNEINGDLDNANIASDAAIAGTKLADLAVTTAKIDDEAVTPAKWTNPYKFKVRRSSAYNSGNGTFTTIVFDSEQLDTNNDFNTSTGEYTVPVTGTYALSWYASSGNAIANLIVSVHVNGSEAFRARGVGTSTTQGAGGSITTELTAGQVLTVRAFGSSAVAMDVNAFANWFSGHLVSET